MKIAAAETSESFVAQNWLCNILFQVSLNKCLDWIVLICKLDLKNVEIE